MRKFLFLALLVVLTTSVLFAGSFSVWHSYNYTNERLEDGMSVSATLTNELSYSFYHGYYGTNLKFSYEGLGIDPWIKFSLNPAFDYSKGTTLEVFDDEDATTTDISTDTSNIAKDLNTVSLGGTVDFEMITLPFSVSFGFNNSNDVEESNPATKTEVESTTTTNSGNSFSISLGTQSVSSGGIVTDFVTILPFFSYSMWSSNNVVAFDDYGTTTDISTTTTGSGDSLSLYLGAALSEIPLTIWGSYGSTNSKDVTVVDLTKKSTTTENISSNWGFGVEYEEEFYGFDVTVAYNFSSDNISDLVKYVNDETEYSTTTATVSSGHSFSVSAEKAFGASFDKASFSAYLIFDLLNVSFNQSEKTVTYEDNASSTAATTTVLTTTTSDVNFDLLNWAYASVVVKGSFTLKEGLVLSTKTDVYKYGFKTDLPTVATLTWTPSDSLSMSISGDFELATLAGAPVPYFLFGNEGFGFNNVSFSVSYSW